MTENIDWRASDRLVPYPDAIAFMEQRAGEIANGGRECVWLLDHPPLYTAGTSAKPADLLTPDRFDVFETGRGGEYTYHGPGQRIAYVLLNLNKRGKDLRKYVWQLEEWIIATLAEFAVEGERREGRVGIWVARGGREDKIAAIGVRVRKWVTFHGLAINVEPELEHFSGIVPCGIAEHGVTSLADLGLIVTSQEVDMALKQTFGKIFG